MWVTAHAVFLLAIPLAGILLCLLGPRKMPSERRFRQPTAAFAILIVVSALTVRPQPGVPWSQSLLLGGTIWLLLFYLRGRSLRHGLSAFMFIMAFLLSSHYGVLVRSGQWVGDAPLHALAVEDVNRCGLLEMAGLIKVTCQDDTTIYPAGWLDEVPFATHLERSRPPYRLYRIEVTRAWHSWYTRLFRYREVPLAVWFPGGKPAKAADALVLKERRNG